MAGGIQIRMSLQGADAIMAALKQLGPAGQDAFNKIKTSTEQASAPLGRFADNLTKAKNIDFSKFSVAGIKAPLDDLAAAGDKVKRSLDGVQLSAVGAGASIGGLAGAHAAAGAATEQHSSKLASIATGFGIVAGAAIALGTSMFLAAKKSADAIKDIKDSADAAGTTLEGFQKAGFVFEQLGLDADETKETITAMAKASTEALKKTIDKIKEMGFRFSDDAGGLKALSGMVERLGGTSPLLQPLIEKLRSMGFAVAPGIEGMKTAIELSRKFGLDGSAALNKLKEATPDVMAQLRSVAELMGAVGSEADRKTIAVAAFGKEIGDKLVDELKDGASSIDEIIDRFQKLGGAVTEAQADLSKDFGKAMAEFNFATKRTSIEFGSHFLPVVTEGITKFVTLLTIFRPQIKAWGETISTTIKSVTADIFKLFSGAGTDTLTETLSAKSGIQNKWLITLRDAFVALGTTVANVFNNVIKPAFTSFTGYVQPVIDKVNEFFGTKLDISQVGIAVILAYLIGGFTGLGVAATTLFANLGPGFTSIKGWLSAFSIDLDHVKAIAIRTWETIKQIFTTEFKSPFGDFGISLEGIAEVVLVLAAGFVILHKAASLLAPILSKVLGRPIRGEAVLFGAVIGQLTGFTQGLVTVLAGAVLTTTLFKNAAMAAGVVLKSIAGLVGWPLVLVAGVVLAIANFKQFAGALDVVAGILNTLFGTEFFTGVGLAKTAILAMAIAAIAGLSGVAKAFGFLGTALTTLAAHPAWAALLVIATALLAVYQKWPQGKGFGEVIAASADFAKQRLEVLATATSWDEIKRRMAEIAKAQEEFEKTAPAQNAGAPAEGAASDWDGLLAKIKEFATEGKSAIVGTAQAAEKLGSNFKTFGHALPSNFKTIDAAIDTTKQKVGGLADELQKLTPAGAATAPGVPSSVMASLTSPFQQAADAIKKIWDDIIAFIGDTSRISGILESIPDKFSEPFRTAEQTVEDIWRKFPLFMSGIINQSVTMVDGLVQKLQQLQKAASSLTLPTSGSTGSELSGGVDLVTVTSGVASPAVASLTSPFQQAADAIKKIWSDIIAFIGDPTSLTAALASIPESLAAPFRAASEAINVIFTELPFTLGSIFNQIASAAEHAASRIEAAARRAADAWKQGGAGQPGAGGGGGNLVEAATGGLFRGRPGIDTNLAWLTDLEYIMNPAAVRKYGVDFMHMINSLRFPGFALGGLNSISLPPPRFSMPALAPSVSSGSNRSLTLVLDTKKFTVQGSKSTIDNLEREAAMLGIATMGPAPGWVR